MKFGSVCNSSYSGSAGMKSLRCPQLQLLRMYPLGHLHPYLWTGNLDVRFALRGKAARAKNCKFGQLPQLQLLSKSLYTLFGFAMVERLTSAEELRRKVNFLWKGLPC
eukprot:3626410-Amphidinium_carterae.1